MVRKGKGKEIGRDKVKKENQMLKRQEKKKENGNKKRRKEEVIVKLEMEDAGEDVIEEDNGLGNDVDVEDINDVERTQVKGKEQENEKE